MTWEILFIFAVLIATVVSFVLEKISSDQTAILAFCTVLGASLLPWADKLPDVETMLGVFSNPAPLTVAAMFILSAALDKCGAIDLLAGALTRLADLGYRRFLLVMTLGVATISAFINNTPVVVVFMPVILSLSRTMNIPASKLLIPLSYASIFGGTCTLVGTSTNILASGMIQKAGHEPIGMFELAAVGVPLLFCATSYMIFIGSRILPHRETLTSILSAEERKEYLTEAFVRSGSDLVGKVIDESGLLRSRGIRLLEIVRNEVALRGDLKKETLREGDRLVLSCRPSGFAHARTLEGLDLFGEQGLDLETISAHEGSIVEGVIGPKSTITGQTITGLNFRQRFRVIILAVHRGGVNMREKIHEIALQKGDTILMMGTDQALENLRGSDDIFLLDRPATPTRSHHHKIPIVVGVLASVVLLAAVTPAPIAALALVGCGLIFATGCLKPKDGYAAVDWSIILLIYSMLGVGVAMESTGAAAVVVNFLTDTIGGLASPELRPYVLLAVVYLSAMIMTEMLSNNAAVVLVAPIAIGLATNLGVDPRPFIIATCIAASASFSTPIGYQTNTYVYGVGGYKFTDFAKVGLPINLIYFSVCIFVIPWIWPL